MTHFSLNGLKPGKEAAGLKADFRSELEAADRLLSKESCDPAVIEELATHDARAGKISNTSGF
jgi:hypothetical protein